MSRLTHPDGSRTSKKEEDGEIDVEVEGEFDQPVGAFVLGLDLAFVLLLDPRFSTSPSMSLPGTKNR
jgi:hypothetical protein